MTSRLLPLLAAIPLGLLSCSTAVPEPVFPEPVVCPAGPLPPFPELHARPCGADVCLTPDDAAAIWLWRQRTERWADTMTACLDAAA
jgi:hypothetical protein